RAAHYRTLDARFLDDVLTAPGVVELTLPDAAALQPWTNLDPLEAGVGDFPPPLEDPVLADRLVTWVRVRAASGSQAAFQWAAISSAPGLPTGMTVTNPVRTWGGAEAETVDAASKQASRFLQHRDRLVTLEDFETILWRTPGVELGRIDALPAFNPSLVPNAPGDAPGAVTVMVVPARDPLHPDAPQPGRPFLDAVCAFADA